MDPYLGGCSRRPNSSGSKAPESFDSYEKNNIRDQRRVPGTWKVAKERLQALISILGSEMRG